MHSLVPDFILLQLVSGKMAGKIQAASLSVDISGFSAVTDALLPYGQHGAEVLAGVLRDTFEPLVVYVYEQGGFISSFGGDGFTALFPLQEDESGAADHNIERDALTAAWRIRQWIAANGEHETPYGRFVFTGKTGAASGMVSWGIVSAENGSRAAFYFRGPAIEGCAAAEGQARPGDIVLDSSLYDQVQSWVSAEPVNGYYRLIFVHGQLRPARPPSPNPVSEAHIGQFYPLELVRSQDSGEFRQVANLFVSLPSVRTEGQLAIFMRSLFALQDRYGGLLGRLDFGSKGSHLFLFWGAPVAHENDVERALNFILDLQTRTIIPIKAGLTYQIAHTGFIGSALREEYTAYGWSVNLAARFMASAPRDEIWVDRHVAQRAKDNFAFEYQGELSFKGFSEQQTVYALIERRERDEFLYEGELIGRRAELQKLSDFVSPIFGGKYAGMLVIRGDPGIGKSRLVHEFQNSEILVSNDVMWSICQTNEISRDSFNPFRYWLRRTWNVSDTKSESRNKRSFSRRLDLLIAATDDQELAAELDRTRSFLGALVGLRWSDSLYEQVEGQQRYENTYRGLSTFLRAQSLQRPVILLLEDVHWLDADSEIFLARFTRSLAREDDRATPLAILATTRFEGVELPMDDFAYQRIDLGRLSRAELAELAKIQLGDPAGQSLLDVLEQRAEGNPFFAEQLLRNLKERDMLRHAAGHWQVAGTQTLSLPTDVGAVLVARLDRLAKEVREVVQTAAVLGREFELWLLSQMLESDTTLSEKIYQAEQAGIWSALSDGRYIFRHALLRDAAYNMQLQARRRALHAMAYQALERFHSGGLQGQASEIRSAGAIGSQSPGNIVNYGDLAYHAEQAGHTEKAIKYFVQAGQEAMQNFANREAVNYFTRALNLLNEDDVATQWTLLLAREELQILQGDLVGAVSDLQAMEGLADREENAQWRAVLKAHQATHLEVAGDYPAAIKVAEEAIELAQKAGLQDQVAEAHLNLGRVYWAQGETRGSVIHMAQALDLYRNLGDRRAEAQALLDYGYAVWADGDAIAGADYTAQALEVARKIGNREIEGQALSNLGYAAWAYGDYAQAERYIEAALAVYREIGAGRYVPESLNFLGHVALAQKDYARSLKLFEEAKRLDEETDSLGNRGVTKGGMADAYAGLGLLEEAEQAYRQAIEFSEDYGRVEPAMRSRANWARMALEQGDVAQARQLVDEIMGWLDEGNRLYGSIEPLSTLAACILVLQASNDPRADRLLDESYARLMMLADEMPDASARRMFIEEVSWNKEIVAMWRARDSTEQS